MASNSLGRIFRITTAGESHGSGLGVIIDGCPPGIAIDVNYIQTQLDRRKPGQSHVTTQRNEADRIAIQSGVHEGISTGAPILILTPNEDTRSSDYTHIQQSFRPSHADYTYHQKYGTRDHRGGGRSSARETVNWVAAGAIAKLILQREGVEIKAVVTAVGEFSLKSNLEDYDWGYAEQNVVRCPDRKMAKEMEALIMKVKNDGDTVGGVITCVINGCPPGLGEPVFHKLHADLGHAMLSINACKGFEYGSGFEGTRLKGSQHNDIFEKDKEVVVTKTNHSGGIQGGITNGMPIYFRVAFKPVSTIMKEQTSLTISGEETSIQGQGRHDPCVVPRAVPIVEAMAALVLVDHWLMQKAYK